jgi:hypothetical protein
MNAAEYADYAVGCLKEKMHEEGDPLSFELLGEVMWAIIRRLCNKEDSLYLRLVDFTGFLDPFCEDFTERTIPEWAWVSIKDQAKAVILYAEENGHTLVPIVKEHLENIVNDKIPFGYSLEKEED